MKRQHLFLTVMLLITTAPHSYAMENNNFITTLKEPHSVVCLAGNTVAILAKDGCNISDFSTNKEIVRLATYQDPTIFQFIAAHPDKKSLALSRAQTLTIYDIATKSKIWKKRSDNASWTGAPVFNATQDSILIGNFHYGVDSFNYQHNTAQAYRFNMISCSALMSLPFHPTKQEFIFNANYHYQVPIVQLDKEPIIKQTIESEHFKYNFKYNHDGSLIAINNQFIGCSIFNPKTGENLDLIGEENQELCGMVFHPIHSILAILPNTGDRIQYWDAITRKLIATTLLDENFFYNYYSVPYSEPLSFSEDGTKLVVALEYKCLILDVPKIVIERIQ